MINIIKRVVVQLCKRSCTILCKRGYLFDAPKSPMFGTRLFLMWELGAGLSPDTLGGSKNSLDSVSIPLKNGFLGARRLTKSCRNW